MRLLMGHTDRVSSLEYSPEGRFLASASKDRTVRLWDLATGEERQTFETDVPMPSIAFSERGHSLVWALSTQVRQWDLETDRETRAFSLHHASYFVLAAAPTSRRIAIGHSVTGSTGFVSLWDAVANDREMRRLYHPRRIGSLAYSPDGRILAVGDRRDGGSRYDVVLWDWWKPPRRIATLRHTSRVQGMAFAPDGRTLATAAGPHAWLWSVPEGKLLARLPGHRKQSNAVAFSPDGSILALASNEKHVKLWDMRRRTEMATFDWQIDRVRSVAFSPDGMTVAAGGEDGRIVVWDVEALGG